jgi:Ca2+-binding RTX toxin-like protein
MLNLMSLESRIVPATTAVFNSGILAVTGDNLSNDIVVSADNAGNLKVTDNGNDVRIRVVSGMANKANTTLILVNAGKGNDKITLNSSLNTLDVNGKLVKSPDAVLNGEDGNDTIQPLIGGFLNGVIGNTIIGNTVMSGGNGNDTLISGFGNDIMYGDNGNDTLIWLPGTLIDVYEGGKGFDNAVVVGNANNQGDNFVLSKHPTEEGRVLFQRTNLVPFFIDIDDCELVTLQTQSGDDSIFLNSLHGTDVRQVRVEGGAGNDLIDATGLNRQVSTMLFGGDGNDTVLGSNGFDVIDGGSGNDNLNGNAGFDVVFGGDGNDTLNGGNDRVPDVLIGGTGSDVFVSNKLDVFFDFNFEDSKRNSR